MILAPATRYTRFVALVKSSLWLLVAVTIGILVWIASDNTGDRGGRVVFSHSDTKAPPEVINRNIMDKPHYQGTDSQNQPFTVSAATGEQIDENHMTLDTITADLMENDGRWLALNAKAGDLNTQTKQLDLTQGVSLFTDGGFEFRTDHAHVDIGQSTAYGDSHIEGQGPPGTLTADSFSGSAKQHIIRFNGSVRMILYH